MRLVSREKRERDEKIEKKKDEKERESLYRDSPPGVALSSYR